MMMREFFGGAKNQRGFDWARAPNSVVPCRERSGLWSFLEGHQLEPPLNGAALHSAPTVAVDLDLSLSVLFFTAVHSGQADRFGFSCAARVTQAQQHRPQRPAHRSTVQTKNRQSKGPRHCTWVHVLCSEHHTSRPRAPSLPPRPTNPNLSYPPSGTPRVLGTSNTGIGTPRYKMKIVESQSALLSNFEVYQHIADQRKRNKAQNRRVPANAHHVMNEVRPAVQPQEDFN